MIIIFVVVVVASGFLYVYNIRHKLHAQCI